MTRAPVAAGLFYPRDPRALADSVDTLLAEVRTRASGFHVHALVAPHAGYLYSGIVAAAALALVPRAATVVLLGPSHFVPFEGIAVSTADAWATPLGDVPVAGELREAALEAGALLDDAPHHREHAIEVELPFLQRVCREGLEIVPIAVGRTRADTLASVIRSLDALVVVSTDLSHYHDAATAQRLDRETADAVVRREPDAIREDAACGLFALRGLVEHARQADLDVRLLDLRTSADAAGSPERVVGYGAFAVGVA